MSTELRESELDAKEAWWQREKQERVDDLLSGKSMYLNGRRHCDFEDVLTQIGCEDDLILKHKLAFQSLGLNDCRALELFKEVIRQAAGRLVDSLHDEILKDRSIDAEDNDFFAYREAV